MERCVKNVENKNHFAIVCRSGAPRVPEENYKKRRENSQHRERDFNPRKRETQFRTPSKPDSRSRKRSNETPNIQHIERAENALDTSSGDNSSDEDFIYVC